MKMRVYAVLAQTGPLPYSVSSFTAFASSFTVFASSSDKLVFVNKRSILPPGKGSFIWNNRSARGGGEKAGAWVSLGRFLVPKNTRMCQRVCV